MKALLIGGLAAAFAFVASVAPLETADAWLQSTGSSSSGVINALPSDSGATSANAPNFNFANGASFASAPSNYGFESGLANWTVTGDPANVTTPTSGGQSGGYVLITNGGMNDWVTSDAFTPTSAGSRLSYYINANGVAPTMNVAVSPYTSWAGLPSTSASGWTRVTGDLSSYVGQAIKIRFRVWGGTAGLDEFTLVDEVPNWGTSSANVMWKANASLPATTGSLGDYSDTDNTCTGSSVAAMDGPVVSLSVNESMTLAQTLTIPPDGSPLFFHVSAHGTGPAVSITVLRDGYLNNTLFNKTLSDGESLATACDMSYWAGQQIKLKIASSWGGSIDVSTGGESFSSYASANLNKQGDPVSTITGAVAHSHTDVAIPSKGIPLEFTRQYTASDAGQDAGLGFGWTHNYSMRLTLFTSGSVAVNYPGGATAFFKNNSGTLTPPMGVFDTLVKNGDNTYTLTTVPQVKYGFDTTGRLTSIRDRNNNITSLSYTSGNLSSVTDPGGHSLSFTWTSGRITQISDPLSRTVQYGYDAKGDLTSVTDVKGGTTGFTYSNHRLLTLTDSLSHLQVTNIYDSANRVVEQTDPTGGVNCFYYGSGPAYTSTNCPGVSPAPGAGRTVMVDSRGKKWIYQYDLAFRPTATEDPLGNDTVVTYEATGALCSPSDRGNLCKTTDPNGHATSFTYDAGGNVLTTTEPIRQPNGAAESGAACGSAGTGDGVDDDTDGKTDDGCPSGKYTYTSLNDLDLATDALGRQADYVYDSGGNLTRVVRKDSSGTIKALTCLERDSSGLVTASVASTDLNVPAGATDACTGNRTLFGYDSYGMQTCAADARFTSGAASCGVLSTKTTFAYDSGGRLTSQTDENRQASGTAESGSQCGTTGTGNRIDDEGDGSVDDGCPNSIYTYDNQNNVLTSTDALGDVTSSTYDAKGQFKTVTDANRVAVGSGESGSACGAAGTGDGTDNDSDGTVDDGCPSSSSSYDNAGRLTAVTDARGSTTTYGYDANSNRTTVTNPLRQTVGTAESGSACGTTGTGNATDDDPDGTIDDGCPSVKYSYDDANRLIKETDALGNDTQYTYWEDAQLKQRTDARQLVTKYFPDASHRPDLIEYWNGTTQTGSVDYGYDVVGNRTSMVDTTGTTTYAYDALNRMTSVTSPGSQTVQYRYDNTGAGGEAAAAYPGQRTKVTYPDSKTATYTYNADGGMRSVTDWLNKTTNYTYDVVGRLTDTQMPNAARSTNTYDAGGRLLSVQQRSGGVLSQYNYAFDAVGNRARMASRQDDFHELALYSSPVGYWRLGETSGTTAADQSGRGNSGTYNNGTTLNQAGAIPGDPDTSASFDGVDDSVSVVGSSSLNNLDRFTIEGWVYLNSYGEGGNAGRLVSRASGNEILFGSSTGFVEFDARRWQSNLGTWRSPAGSIKTGQWYHIAVTYDYGSTANDPRIYINGDEVKVSKIQSPAGTLGSGDTNTLYIGNDAGGAHTFDGRVDEVAIYNSVLPRSVVASHVYQAMPNYRALALRDNPRAYWRLGESSGTTAEDDSGNGLVGTYHNGASFGAAGAITADANTAISLDGTDDYVASPYNSALNTDSFSLELWAKADQLRIQGLVLKNYSSSWRVFMRDTSGHIEFDALADTKNCWTTGNDIVRTDKFTHVVVTFDKPQQEMRIYMDGALRATCGGVADIGNSLDATIQFGPVGGAPFWDGRIDEAAFYDYALAPDAVLDHFQQRALTTQSDIVLADQPAGYWRLDETSGTTATDESGHGNAGTYNNGTTLDQLGAIPGDPDTSASFDGSDDSVSVAGSTSLNNLSQLSLEGWVYLDSWGEASLGRLISRSGGNQIFFVSGSGGYLQFEALRWQTAIGKWRSPTSIIGLSRWYHIVVTYDYGSTTNDPVIYIDGQSVAVTEVQAPSGALGTADTGTIYIGNTPDGARTFDGRIDDVAYYDHVLTPEQVKRHYGDMTTYGYDAAYQLTSVQYPDATTDTYTYDGDGNRLTKNSTSYTYNAADRMLTAGGTSYGYDENGNQTSRGSDTFGWDPENRMTSTSIGGSSGSYAYNGDGLRASRTLGGTTTSYRWDVAAGLPQVLQDSDSNTYVYGVDLISRTDSSGSQEYYLTDGLGSTTGLTTGTGALADTYAYDVFGATLTHTGSSSNEFTFTGEQVDATGLQYLRARYYDLATGRFVSRDPLPFTQRYAYADSDPVNRVDPTGLDDNEPVPVPLPSVPRGKGCQEGWEDCMRMAGKEWARQPIDIATRKRYLPIRSYTDVCDDFLWKCEDGKGQPRGLFDTNGARQRMRSFTVVDEGDGLLDRLRRFEPPETGTGGYLDRDNKEGVGFGQCPVGGWYR